jgi:universal stress protein E
MIVIDPALELQPALLDVLEPARAMGARLHLYACLDETAPAAAAAAAERLLDGLTGQAVAAGLAVSSELERDADWQVQAVRAASRCGADLLVKYSFDHSALQRELRATSDWTVLRKAPCPVLLVKHRRSWTHQGVLGAVNFNARDGAHARLNNLVISATRGFASALGARQYFINACEEGQDVPDASAIAGRCSVPEEQVLVCAGPPPEAIVSTAEMLEVDLIVLGTVGRSGLVGKWIGNTVEKLLDHTHIDILVVN